MQHTVNGKLLRKSLKCISKCTVNYKDSNSKYFNHFDDMQECMAEIIWDSLALEICKNK